MAYFNLQVFAADGHLNFETKLDESGFSGGIKRLGSIAKGGMAVLGASVAGVTAGFAALSKEALDSVASLEQNVGGVETLFKDNAQTVIDNANKAYKTAGLSANEYMSSVTSFSASLLQSVAGDTAEAARVADMAMVDMSDNANKMGTDMTSIQNAYQGFAKQNYTMLDNLKLGYGGTKEEMQRLLEDASKISGVKYDISNLNDVYSAIHTVQGELDITGTTAKEASTTIEGSMNAAKAAYDNFLNGSGSADELADAVSTAIGNITKNLGDIIPRLAETVPKVLETLGKEFEGGADQFMQVGLDLVGGIAAGILEGLPKFAEFGWNMISTVITSITENAPMMSEQGVLILSQLIEGLGSGSETILETGMQLITVLADSISSALPQLIPVAVKAILNFVQNIVNNLPKLLDAGLKMLQSLAQGIANSLPSVIELVPKLINSFADTIYKALPQILAAGVKLIVTLGKGIINSVPTIIANAGEIMKAIINVISMTNLLSLGKSLISGLINGIKSMGASLSAAGGNIIKNLINTIRTTDWISVGKNMITGMANGVKNNAKQLVEAAAAAVTDALNWVKEKLGIHSPSRVFRDEVGKNIALGIAEGISQNKEYAKKSAEEIAQATLDAAKKKLDNHKVYNDLTLADEAAFWDSVRKQTGEGTQARIDADKEYFNAKKSIDSQMLQLEENYTKNVADAYRNLNDKITSLNKEYSDAVTQRADQIKSSFGLFDEFGGTSDLTSEDLLNNLHGQVEGIRQWKNNLSDLEDRGIGEDLLAELQALGPKAAGEIQLMTEMSDEQLDEYVSLFKAKNRLARKQAVEEMEPMREEISGQITKIKQETAYELSQYQKQYTDSMTQLGVSLNQPLETMKLTAAQNAIELVAAMADSVKSASGVTENVDKFKAIAENVLGATQTLPASMLELGQNAITSMITGINSMSGSLYEAISLVVGTAVNGAVDAALNSGVISDMLSAVGGVTGTSGLSASVYGNEGYSPGSEVNYKRLGQEVSGAISGMSVVMDGNRVGTVVAGAVNSALGSQGAVKGRDG